MAQLYSSTWAGLQFDLQFKGLKSPLIAKLIQAGCTTYNHNCRAKRDFKTGAKQVHTYITYIHTNINSTTQSSTRVKQIERYKEDIRLHAKLIAIGDVCSDDYNYHDSLQTVSWTEQAIKTSLESNIPCSRWFSFFLLI